MTKEEIKKVSEAFIDRENKKADVPDGILYDAWRLKILSPSVFAAFSANHNQLSIEQLLYFCSFGVLAPTSHNSVPERFKLGRDKNTLEVWLDRELVLPKSDPTGKQALMSLGSAVRNIEIAAAEYGYTTTTKFVTTDSHKILPLQSNEDRYVHILTLEFHHTNHTVNDVLPLLLEKKVVRGQYDDAVMLPEALATEIKERIKQAYPSVVLTLITDRHTLHTVGKYQEDADRTVFEDPDFTFELGHYLLSNDDKERNTGMRGVEFGLDDAFAKRVHKGLLRQERLLPDEIASFAKGGRMSVENSSAVIILSSQHETIEQYVQVGKAYQDCALTIYKHNFFHSVYAGITEVIWVRSIFATTVLNTNAIPLMLFRVGIPKRNDILSRPHSVRPLLNELFLEE